MWILSILIVLLSVLLCIPLGHYLACVLDRPPGKGIERMFDTGPQSWKAYCYSMLWFNLVLFLFGFTVLALQPWLPLNPDGKKMLAASTIFNTAISFLTNTNLQHYSGEVHLSYGSQLFVICFKQFVTPAIGLAALLAILRGLRGDGHLGNFYVDLWRGIVLVFLPLAIVLGVLLLLAGMPMTLAGNADYLPLQGGEAAQLARGPVAAIVAIKQLGTNGGGFFGPNSCHPFENPGAWTNLLECISIVLVPMACLILFGKMIKQMSQARILFGLSLVLLTGLITFALASENSAPNPALASGPALLDARGKPYQIEVVDASGQRALANLPLLTQVPRVALPVLQRGNLEGKELRFGPAAGATWAALTTCTSNGSVNCMHDSLNPLTGLVPLLGMWFNCVFGGVGVGLINLLIYLIVAVFIAGLMVGRTPEYLGKKVEAKEMKLASLALLAHPLLILIPTALFAALAWGTGSTNNPGAHGFSELLYEFTSAAANNGSGFEGLADTAGFAADPPGGTYAFQWDLATGVVMLLGRFIPIIAPLALAGSLAGKKRVPFTVGTLRTDTVTFGVVLLGTIVLVGALLFLPVAVLGPVAEHLGPMPLGR